MLPEMSESESSFFDRPWPVRWAVAAPVAAVAAAVFFARAWGVPWHGYSVASVAVAAWIFAMWTGWSWRGGGREGWWAVAMLAVAVAVVGWWAGWRLPRGLVVAAVPVGVLSVFHCLLGSGGSHPWLLRAAVAAGGLLVLLVVLTVPAELLAPGVAAMGGALVLAGRLVVAAAVVAGVVSVWREAGRVRVGVGVRRLVRAGLFAAGVWLPMIWWRPEGLWSEFERWENAAFVVLVLLVGWARPAGTPDGYRVMRRHVAMAAGLLSGAAVFGAVAAGGRGHEPTQTVFLGVAVGALGLAALTAWPWRGGRLPVWAWWPEVVLVLMAWVAWMR